MKKLLSLLLSAALLLTMSGCMILRPILNGSIKGYIEGRLGETLQTAFCDFTVNSAFLCNSWEGYVPSEPGYILLAAEVTVENTMTETITMFDSDFQLQWNEGNGYDVPVTCYGVEPVSDTQFPGEYKLGISEQRTGVLLYEIPAGYQDFAIVFLEIFEDDTEGDSYFVYFTAEDRTDGVFIPPRVEEAV